MSLENNPIIQKIRETRHGGAIEITTSLLPELKRLVEDGVLRHLSPHHRYEYMIRSDLISQFRLFSSAYHFVHRIEPGEAYEGWVTSGEDPEEWWEDTETACEWYDDNDRDRPEYLFGSSPIHADLNAEQILDDLCEDLAVEGPEDWDSSEIRDKLNGIEELKAAIHAFNEANTDSAIYHVEDRSVRVYLPRKP